MNADGTDQRPLTRQIPVDGGGPTWSPDGTQIAFTTYDPQITGGGGIGVINSDGTSFRHLVEITAYPSQSNPVWSPDGEYIAYTVTQANTPDQIYVIHADGTGEPELLVRDAKQLSWTE
jgi:Tol biopolymer transport system component